VTFEFDARGIRRRVGRWTEYYKNGDLRASYSFNNKGECDGLYDHWDENGHTHYIINFVNGERHGLYKIYINEKLHRECIMCNRSEIGIRKEYMDDNIFIIILGDHYWTNGADKIRWGSSHGKILWSPTSI
jgi:antitoxin component YwqK of YwqJK toxin-antitoxin module